MDIPYKETAGVLARSLCDLYGEKLREKLFPSQLPGESRTEEEKFGSDVIILINGRHVCHLGGMAAPLKPDDRVDIFPLVAGG